MLIQNIIFIFHKNHPMIVKASKETGKNRLIFRSVTRIRVKCNHIGELLNSAFCRAIQSAISGKIP